MNISQAGIDLIKEFEGCKLTAYPDPATGGAPWTIGVGHTGDVKPGDTITQQEADKLLMHDLSTRVAALNELLDVDVTQGQFDALCSFVFNLGIGALKKSSLLRLLNEGDADRAAEEFPKWDRAGGREMAGLKRRRLAEKALFESDT